MITREDKIAAIRREIALRKNVYPKRIEMGRMSKDKANREIEVMEAILHDYIGPEPSLTVHRRKGNDMKKLALAGALLASTAIPAAARLQIAFTDGTSVITCADGQACDLSGPSNNILVLNETVGAFHIVGTVAASTSALGGNNLQFSTSLIQNTGPTLGHLTAIVGDTNFIGPADAVRESASLTFNNATGSGASTLRFFADPANGQPAGVGLAIPGVQLFSTSGSPVTDPDSFAGTNLSPFAAGGLFSMTETANLALKAGGSITGFNESMESSSAIPEASTWAMLGLGFGGLAFLGAKRARKDRFASLA